MTKTSRVKIDSEIVSLPYPTTIPLRSTHKKHYFSKNLFLVNLKLILDNNNDLNQFDEHGIPVLYYAIKHKNAELTELLLEKGACATYEVNGRVAFEWALDTKNLDIIALLVETVPKSQLLTLYNTKGNNCFHI